MGLFSWLFSCSAKKEMRDSNPIMIDLGQFRCNSTTLGETPEPGGFFHGRFDSEGVFSDASQGLELGVSDGRLDYIFVTVGRFPGRFVAAGKELSIGAATTETEVQRQLGEPYWRHEDSDEVILFYEDCRVELQFEFPHKESLGFVTILLAPILSDPEQRKAYGVSKPWPPAR